VRLPHFTSGPAELWTRVGERPTFTRQSWNILGRLRACNPVNTLIAPQELPDGGPGAVLALCGGSGEAGLHFAGHVGDNVGVDALRK